ncbi:MAG: hypothetical protein LBL35_08610 [Clostridiales bacterium]|jgi:hypothetical protein|nr:hypothetical protein [Clostridiales bacterium]
MAAFELNNLANAEQQSLGPSPRPKEEGIIAFKVYDSCRSQDCLTFEDLGPIRAAECYSVGAECVEEGDIVHPPVGAASVSVDRLSVKKFIIGEKEPCSFNEGYWDIEVKYLFLYRLTFKDADGCPIISIWATSSYNKRVSLFGSVNSDVIIGTDLVTNYGEASAIHADPYVMVEAKGVALSSAILYPSPDNPERPRPTVTVTIGLFSTIKLFRIVTINVPSKGFCIPEECSSVDPLNPCDYFNSLEFPKTLFSPVVKEDFLTNERPGAFKPCGCD